MSGVDNYIKRKPLLHRPWVTGKLYDDLTRASVLHLDAYVMDTRGFKALVMDWRERGRTRMALDVYAIEHDGLTPVWDAVGAADSGSPVFWSPMDRHMFAAIHQRVLVEARIARASGRWGRVSVQAHYVMVRETDCEIAANAYNAPKTYARNNDVLPDIL